MRGARRDRILDLMQGRPEPARDAPQLALVIPAYHEERRLPQTLPKAIAHLRKIPFSWEIRVVDDGSADGTAAVVEELSRDEPRLLLQREPHRGKGGAVRAGMLASRAQFRFLCDADFSMPVEEVERFLPPRLDAYDVAIGTREGPGAQRFGEPWTRHAMGRVFNGIVQVALVPGVADSQCGFKCFTAGAAEQLFARQTIDGFAFDVEILFLARRAGLRVVEVPIRWYYMDSSSVRPLRDTWRMLREVGRIRANDLRGRYST
jgi:glycosyltransferase involved in cell wall biosynthesis